MNGSAVKLVSFLEGTSKRFVIPVYQRYYDWKTENCRQLLSDLVKVAKQNLSSHFFGSIVSYYNDDAPKEEYQIIDGQQRITTVMLLLLAMHDLIRDKKVTTENAKLQRQIKHTYLIDEYDDDDPVKLRPVKADRAALAKLFDGDSKEFISGSTLTVNYLFFYNELQQPGISVDALFAAVKKLDIIYIKLNKEDDPQRIFESLNSTGLALSESDKIRNFMLMGIPDTKLQTKLHEKYWCKVEACTGDQLENFMRDFLAVRTQSVPNVNRIYAEFKRYAEDSTGDAEALLTELLAHAKRYEVLLKANVSDKTLKACLLRHQRLGVTFTRPFLMEVLRLQEENMLSSEDVADILLTVESFLFRRTMCGMPTMGVNKFFQTLHRDILQFDGTADGYVQKFRYLLLSRTDTKRFPTDEEFREAFRTRGVYREFSPANRAYLFERLENAGTVEDKDIFAHLDDGTYSIEHIMPQTLTSDWQQALGSDWTQIHETWLHRVANLTLTGYNSRYSNNSFEMKRDMQNGFRQSGIRLNAWIGQQKQWTLAELEARADLLSDQALGIWPRPKSDFVPEVKQQDSCTLADDIDTTGRNLARFRYRGADQSADSWIDMFEKMLLILDAEDQTVLPMLAASENRDDGITLYFSMDPSKLRSALRLENGIYVEKNTSTMTKIKVLRRLFAIYDVDPDDLVFCLKDAEAEDSLKAYWTKALPAIKAAHADTGCFCNVQPCNNYTTSGWFGIGGFRLSCGATKHISYVCLWLDSVDAERNKSAYDYLFEQKNEIETALGFPLLWVRLAGKSASRISFDRLELHYPDVSQWDELINFHAAYSKRFYDVFVPLLEEWKKTSGL